MIGIFFCRMVGFGHWDGLNAKTPGHVMDIDGVKPCKAKSSAFRYREVWREELPDLCCALLALGIPAVSQYQQKPVLVIMNFHRLVFFRIPLVTTHPDRDGVLIERACGHDIKISFDILTIGYRPAPGKILLMESHSAARFSRVCPSSVFIFFTFRWFNTLAPCWR